MRRGPRDLAMSVKNIKRNQLSLVAQSIDIWILENSWRCGNVGAPFDSLAPILFELQLPNFCEKWSFNRQLEDQFLNSRTTCQRCETFNLTELRQYRFCFSLRNKTSRWKAIKSCIQCHQLLTQDDHFHFGFDIFSTLHLMAHEASVHHHPLAPVTWWFHANFGWLKWTNHWDTERFYWPMETKYDRKERSMTEAGGPWWKPQGDRRPINGSLLLTKFVPGRHCDWLPRLKGSLPATSLLEGKIKRKRQHVKLLEIIFLQLETFSAFFITNAIWWLQSCGFSPLNNTPLFISIMQMTWVINANKEHNSRHAYFF